MTINNGQVSSEILNSLIMRIETKESEKADTAEDIKDVYAEAKSKGFDVKVMKKIISLRKMEASKRVEQETILDLYKSALGM